MKVPSKIFEWVLNSPLNFGVMDLFIAHLNIHKML